LDFNIPAGKRDVHCAVGGHEMPKQRRWGLELAAALVGTFSLKRVSQCDLCLAALHTHKALFSGRRKGTGFNSINVAIEEFGYLGAEYWVGARQPSTDSNELLRM
jgi:hypothetical protein